MSTQPNIALVYDWITAKYGGAESVLQALHELYPTAPLYTTVRNARNTPWADNFSLKTSFLQHIPGAANHYRAAGIVMPLALESFDLSQYDIVISVTGAQAKGVITNSHQLHFCYLFTPTRYLYSHYQEYRNTTGLLRYRPIRWLSQFGFRYLRWWDQVAIWRPDVIYTISHLAAQRMQEFYQRPTDGVVYPPIKIKPEPVPETMLHVLERNEYFLSLSRLVNYKRLDAAIQACINTGKTLVIAGTGPALDQLQKTAGNHAITRGTTESLTGFFARSQKSAKSILFMNECTPVEKNGLLANMRALILPAEEDFGISAIEAAIYGKPVILYHKSGAAEVLQEYPGAVFLEVATVGQLERAMEKCVHMKLPEKVGVSLSQKLDVAAFKATFSKAVDGAWQAFMEK